MDVDFRGTFDPKSHGGGVLRLESFREPGGSVFLSLHRLLMSERVVLVSPIGTVDADAEHVSQLQVALRPLPLKLKARLSPEATTSPAETVRPFLDPGRWPLCRLRYRDLRLQVWSLGSAARQLLEQFVADLKGRQAVCTTDVDVTETESGATYLTMSFHRRSGTVSQPAALDRTTGG